ncbi:MAG: TolC family protein [Planctomycetaceae bacterium]|nr:TolC family protein [Planctomycetaceae bacterium]
MNQHSQQLRLAASLLGTLCLLVVMSGCSRKFWREQADHDSYELIAEKMSDPDWEVPRMDITPDPRSRFYDPFDPDHAPLPPDDAAANEFLHEVGGWKGYKSWHKFGRAFSVENPHWLENLAGGNEENKILQTSAEGTVSRQAELSDLNLGELIELSYIHNRDYQTEVENVYLQALDVSEERFAFNVRYLRTPGASGSTPSYSLNGETVPEGRNSLGFGSGLGISQVLPTGAQWALEMTNNTLWVFSGGSGSSASAISYSLVQPLMRNAGRKVGLENLTLSERQLLYAVRDLARFRKVFFGNVAGSRGYLGLLQQQQEISNQRDNIQRLERRVEELTILASKGREGQGEVFDLNIAQLASRLTSQRNRLRQSEIQLQDRYDSFKISLGLPPDLTFSIDSTPLKRFELIDPQVLEMELRVYRFKGLNWGDLDPPEPADPDAENLLPNREEENEPLEPRVELPDEEYHRRAKLLRKLYDDVIEIVIGNIQKDFDELDRISEQRMADMTPEEVQRFQEDIQRDKQQFNDAQEKLNDLLEVDPKDPEKGAFEQIEILLDSPELTTEDKKAIYDLGSHIYDELYKTIQNLEVIQVNQRVETILLEPFDLSLEEAIQISLENRLDLKNSLAILNDSRRAVEIAANNLEAGLNVRVEGDVRTPNGSNNPVDFRGSASSYRAGIEFDTPLDQLQERNAYRSAQIRYQRARRAYMAAEDAIKQDVRQAWRQLQVLKLNFETARRSIRLAAIQLDAAVESSRDPRQAGGSGGQGLNLLNALNSVLDAQNQFIGIWVQYQDNRINIYRDMGIMEIDDRGLWDDRFYQELANPGVEPPKITPDSTEPKPFPDSAMEWGKEVDTSSLSDRSEAKSMSALSLPPLPGPPQPVWIREAEPLFKTPKTTQTRPRKGLPDGSSSQHTARHPVTNVEELRNAQTSPPDSDALEIQIDSAEWKLPIVR